VIMSERENLSGNSTNAGSSKPDRDDHPHKSRARTESGDAPTAFTISRTLVPSGCHPGLSRLWIRTDFCSRHRARRMLNPVRRAPMVVASGPRKATTTRTASGLVVPTFQGARHSGGTSVRVLRRGRFRQATARPKEMETPYNWKLSTPQSWKGAWPYGLCPENG
jgi:hypothetical protein